jgi:hypothetical protein
MMNRKVFTGMRRMCLAMLAWGIESWAIRLDFGAMAITVGLPDEAALLGVLRPPNGADPRQATYGYPDADGLFVFHAIPAIGNKFHAPEKVGPQSQPTGISEPLVGSVWLLFE